MPKYEGTLLVVDDFELNRDMLTRRLESRGFVVYSADCGLSALQKVEDLPRLDLVLLDIMMPDLDGYAILEKIRAKLTSADIAVIMVTAKDQSEDIVKALELGADDYITKPIDFPVALARISNQLMRRKAEYDLRESEERYALAAQGANDGLWDWDLRSGVVYYSDRWKSMLGFAKNEIGDTIDEWFDRVHPDDLIRLKQEAERHLKGATPKFSCEYRMIMNDGSWRWLLTRGSAVADRNCKNCRMVGWQTDATERVEHDRLTALPNRGLFLDRLAWAFAKGQRTNDDNFAVFYLGLDRFKIINESLGHERGDWVLQKVSERIEQLIRPQDTLARMGGDEFALLTENLEGIGSATRIADRIKSSIGRAIVLGDDEVHITISTGIVWGSKVNDGSGLLRMAHAAMEVAKARGKNTYEFYQEGMDASQVSTLKMENRLRKALELNELFLVYQPQISTRTGKVIGVEALLRWKNGDRIISPVTFIPLAEETGLIEPIGEWVLHTACEQNMAFQRAGLPPIRMAVNVSSRQFRQPESLLAAVKRTLQKTGLQPHLLDLELTESLLMENMEQTRSYLDHFHELGVHLSLDDFGTGYSSLAYLKKFPIDTLKIDQSFVKEITTDQDDAAICKAIIGMAHSLRMSVIAEGVETEAHLKYLKDLHCDQMQGYFFSRPTSPEDIVELLKINKSFT